MAVHPVIRPLVRGSTYRRAVHLLLGAVILLPYVLLAVAFLRVWQDSATTRGLVVLLMLVASGIAVVPAFLDGTRSLEIAAARALLGVDLPDPVPAGPGAGRETRLRTAMWYAVHLVTGGLVALGLLIAVPFALVFLSRPLGLDPATVQDVRIGPLTGDDTGWLSLIGVLLLIGLGYAVAGLGELAATMAPVLLGPSVAERLAALEARAGRLAERNRLARELHDSVGHALTVTIVQAGAARQLLDTDPDFARRALTAIEDTARSAAEELDQVVGMLRDPGVAGTVTQPTLADLDRLFADARDAGLDLDARVTGAPDRAPAVVSREGYRIVQEGLTNAVRHAGGERVALRVACTDEALQITIENRVVEATRRRPGGRGLTGMAERVDALGGQLALTGDTDPGRGTGVWRVTARLPYGRGHR